MHNERPLNFIIRKCYDKCLIFIGFSVNELRVMFSSKIHDILKLALSFDTEFIMNAPEFY